MLLLVPRVHVLLGQWIVAMSDWRIENIYLHWLFVKTSCLSDSGWPTADQKPEDSWHKKEFSPGAVSSIPTSPQGIFHLSSGGAYFVNRECFARKSFCFRRREKKKTFPAKEQRAIKFNFSISTSRRSIFWCVQKQIDFLRIQDMRWKHFFFSWSCFLYTKKTCTSKINITKSF